MDMNEPAAPTRRGAFAEEVRGLVDEIKALYQENDIPWIVGYSGGKDSTAVLQLVIMVLRELPAGKRRKTVHVISTDTLVENPVVAAWVNHSLLALGRAAAEAGLPIEPHRLTPTLDNSFWVNLIGRGYPAPRHLFRWCTDRLKIKTSNGFIERLTADLGMSILLLGVRKTESAARARVMERLEQRRVMERLSPSPMLKGCLVYSPIEAWTNDDVWTFLMQVRNPWGRDNTELLTMYQGASADGECPLVVDDTTPSCGDSRFGCWVCTMVEEDKSMTAMIANDHEKEWLRPLLDFRNELDVFDDRPLRDFRKIDGQMKIAYSANSRQLYHVHGPYTQASREMWLRKLLEAQQHIRENPATPEEFRDIELVSLEELQEIRRMWVEDKHEIEDNLPRLYEAATGQPFPMPAIDDNLMFSPDDIELLREVCGEDDGGIHFGLMRALIDVERRALPRTRRTDLLDQLEKEVRKGFYDSPQDAIDYATRQARRKMEARGLALESEEEAAGGVEVEVVDGEAAAEPLGDMLLPGRRMVRIHAAKPAGGARGAASGEPGGKAAGGGKTAGAPADVGTTGNLFDIPQEAQ